MQSPARLLLEVKRWRRWPLLVRAMFGLWKTAKARRAARNMISPWVDYSRHRLGTIPDKAWHEPYIIGFMVMLISLAANIKMSSRIADDAMGLVQLQAWADITGMQDDHIGQEISLLSSRRDLEFGEGCNNAQRFIRVFSTGHDPDNSDISEVCETGSFHTAHVNALSLEHIQAFGKGGMLAAALWELYFEEKIH